MGLTGEANRNQGSASSERLSPGLPNLLFVDDPYSRKKPFTAALPIDNGTIGFPIVIQFTSLDVDTFHLL